MLQLKFTAPLDQVHVCLVLTNPSTGKVSTIDAKVDTGSAVTLVPKVEIQDLGLESMGEVEFGMADGTPLRAEAMMCNVSFSDEDTIDLPIYACKSQYGTALLGMDILGLCNYSHIHKWTHSGHEIEVTLELLGEEAMF